MREIQKKTKLLQTTSNELKKDHAEIQVWKSSTSVLQISKSNFVNLKALTKTVQPIVQKTREYEKVNEKIQAEILHNMHFTAKV